MLTLMTTLSCSIASSISWILLLPVRFLWPASLFFRKSLGNPSIHFSISTRRCLIGNSLFRFMGNLISARNNIFLVSLRKIHPIARNKVRSQMILWRCPTIFSMLSQTPIEMSWSTTILKWLLVTYRVKNSTSPTFGSCSMNFPANLF